MTYDERPKLRDTQQKTSLFLRKQAAFLSLHFRQFVVRYGFTYNNWYIVDSYCLVSALNSNLRPLISKFETMEKKGNGQKAIQGFIHFVILMLQNFLQHSVLESVSKIKWDSR